MPTLRSFSSSAASMTWVPPVSLIKLSPNFYLLERISIVDDAQTFQGQKLIHLVNAIALRSDHRREPTGRDHFGVDVVFLLNALDDAVDQSDIAVKNAGLNRVDGVPADDVFRLDDFNTRQLRSAFE